MFSMSLLHENRYGWFWVVLVHVAFGGVSLKLCDSDCDGTERRDCDVPIWQFDSFWQVASWRFQIWTLENKKRKQIYSSESSSSIPLNSFPSLPVSLNAYTMHSSKKYQTSIYMTNCCDYDGVLQTNRHCEVSRQTEWSQEQGIERKISRTTKIMYDERLKSE